MQAEIGDAGMAKQTLDRSAEFVLRMQQLHPLDRKLPDQLNVQLHSGDVSGKPSAIDL